LEQLKDTFALFVAYFHDIMHERNAFFDYSASIEIFQTSILLPFLFTITLSTRMGTQLAAFVRVRILIETTERYLFPHFNTLCGSIWLKWRRPLLAA